MPELPEITVIAGQMNKELAGKRVLEVEARQPKTLNIPAPTFAKTLKGKAVKGVTARGKWLFVELDSKHFLLINLGMGAELVYFKPDGKLPETYQFRLAFSDGSGFTARFWWFGYIHLVAEKNLSKHKMTASLGISTTDKALTLERFKELLERRKRSNVKAFLLDQKNMAGIGNVYAQDPLFMAKLHPNRKISTLSEKEIEGLYRAVREVLNKSIKLRGLAYETDFYGRKGGFTGDMFLVGYKQGKPCPTCGTTIQKIKTGTTATYICPKCQPLK
jgi:formamidopyrimidine-DNA glycosylase